MRETKPGHNWFYVDESGDTVYFNKHGSCIVGRGAAPILLLGFVNSRRPRELRRAMISLHEEIRHDPYLQEFPSFKKHTLKYLHAKNDRPEVRYIVFRTIRNLDFKAQFVVIRKDVGIFRRRFKNRREAVYEYAADRLFENSLHKREHNHITFASRGNRDRSARLARAIGSGVERFEEKWGTEVRSTISVTSQAPAQEPMLALVDYMNWAVQRVFTNQEDAYFNFISDKVSLVLDPFDTANYPHNYYTKQNPLAHDKITPLELGLP